MKIRIKGLLTAFLLTVGLCFVPVLGYGEIKEWIFEPEVEYIDFQFLDSSVKYIMAHPDTFLMVGCRYDKFGVYAERYPPGVRTMGKVCVIIKDNRGTFSGKYGRALLKKFKEELEKYYFFISGIATDMDTDVLAEFADSKGKTLGFFYQGEYHLWEK